MTTLISTGNSEGTYGHCDAKCYNATGGHCHCICGGMNHGKGEAGAREQTSKMSAEMLREVERRGGTVAPELMQKALL